MEKGELESGCYYVKNEFGNIFISDYSENYDYIEDKVVKDFFSEVSKITEVIAPVPSYDRFCRLNHLENDFIKAHERINELEKENTQLHKFLEEFNALEVAEENEALKTKLSIQREYNEELKKACKMRDEIIKKYEDTDDWWKKENQQLKELLKECDNELKILRMLSLPMASKGALSECDDLLSKIDNAIGEKK